MAAQNEHRATFGGTLSQNAFSGFVPFTRQLLYIGSKVFNFGCYGISVCECVRLCVYMCVSAYLFIGFLFSVCFILFWFVTLSYFTIMIIMII